MDCDCPDSYETQCKIIAHLVAFIADSRQWMPLNGLKLNDGKMEFLAIHSKYKFLASTPTILVGQDEISPSAMMRNLGVIFNSTLSLHLHISSVVKATLYQLCQIVCICWFLAPSATKTMVRSLISSRLDYCKSALVGLRKCRHYEITNSSERCSKIDHAGQEI